jgi:hypothetical protein
LAIAINLREPALIRISDILLRIWIHSLAFNFPYQSIKWVESEPFGMEAPA